MPRISKLIDKQINKQTNKCPCVHLIYSVLPPSYRSFEREIERKRNTDGSYLTKALRNDITTYLVISWRVLLCFNLLTFGVE